MKIANWLVISMNILLSICGISLLVIFLVPLLITYPNFILLTYKTSILIISILIIVGLLPLSLLLMYYHLKDINQKIVKDYFHIIQIIAQLILIPLAIAGVGYWGSNAISNSQIKSAMHTAEADRQVKEMEIIYKEIMYAKNDKMRIERSLKLLSIQDPEIALKIAISISKEKSLKDVSDSIIERSLDNIIITRFYSSNLDVRNKAVQSISIVYKSFNKHCRKITVNKLITNLLPELYVTKQFRYNVNLCIIQTFHTILILNPNLNVELNNDQISMLTKLQTYGYWNGDDKGYIDEIKHLTQNIGPPSKERAELPKESEQEQPSDLSKAISPLTTTNHRDNIK